MLFGRYKAAALENVTKLVMELTGLDYTHACRFIEGNGRRFDPDQDPLAHRLPSRSLLHERDYSVQACGA